MCGARGEGATPSPPRLCWGGAWRPLPRPSPPPWAMTKGRQPECPVCGSGQLLLAGKLSRCPWRGFWAQSPFAAGDLVLPCHPRSLSSRHLREELQLLLQLSEWWHLRPRDRDLPLPSWRWGRPLRGRWVPRERTGAPPLSSTPSVCRPSPRLGRQGHGGGPEFPSLLLSPGPTWWQMVTT